MGGLIFSLECDDDAGHVIAADPTLHLSRVLPEVWVSFAMILANIFSTYADTRPPPDLALAR